MVSNAAYLKAPVVQALFLVVQLKQLVPNSDDIQKLTALFFVCHFHECWDVQRKLLHKFIEKLLAALAFTAYSELASCTDASEAARLCENLYTKQAYKAETIAFGPELIVCYLVRKEYEVKNLRILLAGKSCGLSADRIRERLRGCDA